MVPGVFLPVRSLPRAINGKVDRQRLAEMVVGVEENKVPIAPEALSEEVGKSSEMEERLAALWKSVLSVESVGVRDSFLRLGGDSLDKSTRCVEVKM